MPTQNPEQEMSSEEREYPRGMTEDGPRRLGPFRLAINVGAASLFISMMSIHLCSLLVIWLVRTLTDVEIDQHSVSANWVLPWGGLASVVIAVLTAVLWVMGRKNNDLELLANNDPEPLVDLEAGRVVEEVYEFTEALRMQEQEHGGLIYFLRTNDGKVLVLFDHESQDIGVQGEDPLTSSFKPRARLTIVRAPETRLVIDRTFSGEPLDAGKPLDLLAPPSKWPEDDEICNIPWDDLEAAFCR
ncbi:MAG: hypothetical protein OEZ03_01820 [Alphaproteobacteria bacterium]|nr:hypothetical protein [Alphaproteobacteria bacterium]